MSAAVVLDSSAAIALLRNEPGAEVVADYIGRAAISAVNLQELVKSLALRGLEPAVIGEIVAELRLDVHPHDQDAAFAAGLLVKATERYGSGIGDRSCMALAVELGVPVLTTDREWAEVQVEGLSARIIR